MYGDRKLNGTCYFGANQVGVDVSFRWYVLPYLLLCSAYEARLELMISGCDGINIAVAQLIIIPRQEGSALKGWTTFFLPIFATLLIISVMGVDLIVRAHLMKDKNIGEVQTESVFWL